MTKVTMTTRIMKSNDNWLVLDLCSHSEQLMRGMYQNEQDFRPADRDEEMEEALPVIPGLTHVELFAFNAEYANAEVLNKIIDWSYDQVAHVSRYRDNYIHVEDLYQYIVNKSIKIDSTANVHVVQVSAKDAQSAGRKN